MDPLWKPLWWGRRFRLPIRAKLGLSRTGKFPNAFHHDAVVAGAKWLRRYALFVACCTFALVIAGGLVTSNDAALSVPDWPLSWGRLVPAMEGGIRYEFAHRVAAMLVGLLTVGLALRLRTRLGWIAVRVVLAQAGLGGVAVRYVTPAWATIAHASLGQLCFAIVVAICVGLYGGVDRVWAGHVPTLICAVALFAQTIVGAGVRHGAFLPMAHVVGAALATILVMWAAVPILLRNMDDAKLRRPAMLLLSLTFSQVFLGIGSYLARVAYVDAPQPMPMMVLFTVAHVAVGSLAVGAAIALGMLARPDALRVQGGMATA